jgi:hypothetical protein
MKLDFFDNKEHGVDTELSCVECNTGFKKIGGRCVTDAEMFDCPATGVEGCKRCFSLNPPAAGSTATAATDSTAATGSTDAANSAAGALAPGMMRCSACHEGYKFDEH